MGFGGISIWQLLIVLVIVLLLFGTKRLKNIGSDLGNAVKGFKGAMATFDASRPIVAAMAVGVGRAALDFGVEIGSRGNVETTGTEESFQRISLSMGINAR